MNWYYHKNLKPIGPFTKQQILEKVLGGEIGPEDLICCDLDNNWKMAHEWPQFKKNTFTAWQKPGAEAHWVLLQWDKSLSSYAQNGPYSFEKITEGIKTGAINPHDYVWKEGLSGWARIKDRLEFKSLT